MDDIIKVVQQVGFPIAVSLYLLIRYDQRLKEITRILERIAVNIEAVKNAVNAGE